jgi:hypothetical protein
MHPSDWSYHQSVGAKTDIDTNTGVRSCSCTYDAAGRLNQPSRRPNVSPATR